MGYAARAATADEVSGMERLLARELDDGGWGLTTGLIYQPGKYSDAAEVVDLAKTAAEHGGRRDQHGSRPHKHGFHGNSSCKVIFRSIV